MPQNRTYGDMRDADVRDPISSPSVIDAPLLDKSNEQLEKLAVNVKRHEGVVSPKAKTAAVILAGGRGTRFGNADGKQLLEILGRPVLTWTAEAFDAVPDVGLIVVVCPAGKEDVFREVGFDPYSFVTPVVFAAADELRQGSAYNGLAMVDDTYEFIIMHDGARPLVTPELINHALSMLKGTYSADGALVGHAAIDTLKVIGDGAVVGTPDRSMFWVAQTPQVFRADVLRRAHAEALAQGFIGTDDSSLVEHLGSRVLLVEGPRDNIKLTVPEDLPVVEAALRARLNAREG